MASKRKFTDIESLEEVKKPSEHRRYVTISASKSKFNGTLSNNFSLQVTQQALLAALNTKSTPKNAAFSPVSIDVVLSVLAAGAEGETLTQLLEFLGFSTVEEVNAASSRISAVLEKSNGQNAPDVSFASGLWINQRYDLNPSFAKNLRDVHRTEARAVDFQNQADEVVKEANLWVTEQSKGLITHFISRNLIKEDTRMLLANALYFKGDWYETFEPENTKNEYFHLLNGDKIRVPFMKQSHTKFNYGTLEGCQILRMMYKEGDKSKKGETPKRFSMYVFLPEQKDGLPNLLEKMKMDSSFFKDKVKLKYKKIDKLVFPKFAFECKFSLRKQLRKIGLKLPFNKKCKEFTRMVDNLPSKDNLYVDEIAQKCRVETNEEGTTAFVVTSMYSRIGAARPRPPPPPVNFVADHPFMFVIREDFSGAVLYVGTVLNPLST